MEGMIRPSFLLKRDSIKNKHFGISIMWNDKFLMFHHIIVIKMG